MNRVSESLEQARFFAWVKKHRKQHPEFRRVFAIPNGGYRDGRTAARMKMEGQEPGVPDIFCAVARDGYHGLFLEMKTATGKLSEAQERMISELSHGDYRVEVVRGCAAAAARLMVYLGMSVEMPSIKERVDV